MESVGDGVEIESSVGMCEFEVPIGPPNRAVGWMNPSSFVREVWVGDEVLRVFSIFQ